MRRIRIILFILFDATDHRCPQLLPLLHVDDRLLLRAYPPRWALLLALLHLFRIQLKTASLIGNNLIIFVTLDQLPRLPHFAQVLVIYLIYGANPFCKQSTNPWVPLFAAPLFWEIASSLYTTISIIHHFHWNYGLLLAAGVASLRLQILFERVGVHWSRAHVGCTIGDSTFLEHTGFVVKRIVWKSLQAVLDGNLIGLLTIGRNSNLVSTQLLHLGNISMERAILALKDELCL